MPRYQVHNFGCRASAADGDAIGAGLEALGFSAADQGSAAVVVVNTCSVTAAAERQARALVRRIHREQPDARVVVTGCYAQRAPDELTTLPGVTAVVGNSHKSQVARVAAGAAVAGPDSFLPLSAVGSAPALHAAFPVNGSQTAFAHAELSSLPLALGSTHRTRPNLRVQDGCGNRCTFCVIPETRGPSRSTALAEAVAAAKTFAADGGQELVLSGINLGRWGRDLQPARTLAELVEALLEETPLPRLRISSVEPMDWTPELIALLARYGGGLHPRLAPHAHLPLQSGCDATLRAMHRRYRPWHYAAKLQAIRAAAPEAALGADVMAGFPGETERHFQESYDFIAAQPLTYLHLFPFSPRPGTAGWALHQSYPVAAEAVRERMRALEALGKAKQETFAAGFAGRRVSAVTLRDGTALTAQFLPVKLSEELPANRLVCLRLASIKEGSLTGVPEVP